MAASQQFTTEQLMGEVLSMSRRLAAMEEKMDAVPHVRHNEEHEYLKTMIEKEAAQRDFWRDISKRLAAAGIIGAIGLLCTAIGYAAIQFVRNGGH